MSAEETASGGSGPEFRDVETIRRPFLPTLQDELPVMPGDAVRIMKPFDDGWAFVERLEGGSKGSKGLIPIDCLRETGQALPAFLAARRVSSNYNWRSNPTVGMAV
jgi:hypothetical protein